MRIIFVRHGHPNYEKDCLTDLGHLQAEAAAERLQNEKIDKFYASSCGRAYETAVHIAKRHGGMEVEKLDFMREIGWGPAGTNRGENGYDPWTLSKMMVDRGQSIVSHTWATDDPFCTSLTTERTLQVGENFDRFLENLGIVRDGEFYRIGKIKYNNALLASHGGSSSAVLTHIFNLPMSFVRTAICPNFTAITVVTFDGEEGSLVSPKIEIMNDARHIEGVSVENVYGM